MGGAVRYGSCRRPDRLAQTGFCPRVLAASLTMLGGMGGLGGDSDESRSVWAVSVRWRGF